MDREDLIRWVGEGRPIEWLFFWGHTPIVKGQVDSSCLSQWYDGLLSKGAMREVDSILGGIDLDRLDVTLLLATLTVTLSASPYLTCRPNLVRGVEGRIRELAPDRVECLMAGLR